MPSQILSTVTKITSSLLMLTLAVGPVLTPAIAENPDEHHHHDHGPRTASPIKHVIVIVGENRSFDHLFATYIPRHGEKVNNLLSEGIVNNDGTPGPNYARALQYSADVTGSATYQLSPSTAKAPYATLPAPLNGGPTNVCADNGMCTPSDAESTEDGLPGPPSQYYDSLLEGGTGLTGKVPDSRISGVSNTAPYSTLPAGPFQLTNSSEFPYISYANSPVHRFYQMWQQEDCSAAHATGANPSGCLADFFTWTEVTVGSNVNGKTQPTPFCTDYAPGCATTGEGATAMGFYNMQQGDAPYTKHLADHYAMSDNYHQPAMGGTGLDSIMLFFGDALWFKDQNGNLTPPHNQTTWAGGPVDEVENPNPVAGSNNWWTQDGYGGFGNNGASTGVYGGGSYSNCSDASQPGVGPILAYLASLKRPVNPNCDPGHYYLLNNYNPGYFGDGSNAYEDTNSNNTPFTIPPTSQRSIADVLLEHNVSWKSYNDQWDNYVPDKYQQLFGAIGAQSDSYCNICNGFQYQTQIMADPGVRTTHIFDTKQLYEDIHTGKLPAVSFVKPSGWVDGHPASSKWDLFEGFVRKIVDEVQKNRELWESTAIFVTVDEGGGYYDSGYVQPLDFFGDGTRIPLIVVSPWTKPGHISHDYADHVSVLKFIEHNWNLPTISSRSRDNLPNPTYNPSVSKYAPTNSPALSDLFDLFDFHDADHDGD
ncbi:MAG TPA: alkaline phosphatase family protein [Terracidiphilus sp.]|nr:alkaline phosphatase family protein [Terracidiphilus sp.]